jgi:hypothetical protein
MTLPRPAVLVASALLVAPAGALAQPLFHGAESIECTVANARAVVVGVIVKVLDGPESIAVTIAVEETLKGEHRDRVKVQLPGPAPIHPRTMPALRVLAALRADVATEGRVIDLSGRGPEVFAADFTVLKEPADVLRAARGAIRRMPGVRRIETFPLRVPARVTAGTRWEQSHGKGVSLILEVPVDEHLEEWALRSILSRSGLERDEGARALRFFRSEANVARVRSLLADPTWAHGMRAEDNMGQELRVYLVREAAYRTLTYWGVKADEPVTREELWLPERVQVVDLSNRRVPDAELDGLARFKNLEDLYLRNEPVTDARLKHLVGLRGLRTLDLGGTEVTDAGLNALAGMSVLRHLSLRGTKVTGEGLRDLAGLDSLDSLDLSQTGITDAGLGHLAGLGGLKVLDLGGTAVSADGVAGLLKLRPELKVRR